MQIAVSNATLFENWFYDNYDKIPNRVKHKFFVFEITQEQFNLMCLTYEDFFVRNSNEK